MAERPAAIDVDVAIAGAGPVGAAFALFLRERGMPADRIALFDARTADAAAADDRMIAISEGSATLLARLGAWHDGDVPRATAIRTIHVSHRGRFGRTVIDARDYGVAALGHVVRHGDLTRALDVALAGSGVVVRRPVRVAAVDADADALRVTTDDAGVVAARHVVHAEGGLFGVQAATRDPSRLRAERRHDVRHVRRAAPRRRSRRRRSSASPNTARSRCCRRSSAIVAATRSCGAARRTTAPRAPRCPTTRSPTRCTPRSATASGASSRARRDARIRSA